MEFGSVTTTLINPSVRLREFALGPVQQPGRRETAQTPAIYLEKSDTDEPEPTYGPDGRRVGAIVEVEWGEEPQDEASKTAAAKAEPDPETSEQDLSAEAADEDRQEEANSVRPRGIDGEPLSDEELAMVEQMAERDREVRAHEQAHKAVGGQYAGAISYDYEQGPDGKKYAVGGEVQIDISEVDGDPEATIRKMQQVRRAALAPAEPSPQDRQVAAEASQLEADARSELRELRSEEREARLDASGADADEENEVATEVEASSDAEASDSKETLDPRVRVFAERSRPAEGLLAYLQARA